MIAMPTATIAYRSHSLLTGEDAGPTSLFPGVGVDGTVRGEVETSEEGACPIPITVASCATDAGLNRGSRSRHCMMRRSAAGSIAGRMADKGIGDEAPNA